MSVEQVSTALHAVLARLFEARESMRSAAAFLDEAAQAASSTMVGTRDPHASDVAANIDRAERDLIRSEQTVQRAEVGIRSYLADIGAVPVPALRSLSRPPEPQSSQRPNRSAWRIGTATATPKGLCPIPTTCHPA
ncbi:hypothetical protein [Alloactinosynnema sp. L-07]|uniref:hypothetical protein n=1 Tax=Alloactinosynnema sp. L-07 TaxID=1653480 RepID=UPI0012FBF9A8|nr:hypothetical protein [Alloactinosynnema sp. L-07]